MFHLDIFVLLAPHPLCWVYLQPPVSEHPTKSSQKPGAKNREIPVRLYIAGWEKIAVFLYAQAWSRMPMWPKKTLSSLYLCRCCLICWRPSAQWRKRWKSNWACLAQTHGLAVISLCYALSLSLSLSSSIALQMGPVADRWPCKWITCHFVWFFVHPSDFIWHVTHSPLAPHDDIIQIISSTKGPAIIPTESSDLRWILVLSKLLAINATCLLLFATFYGIRLY